MIRKPIVAGQFYPASKEDLNKQIKDSFLHGVGPGKIPGDKRKGRIKAIIAPHAGYMFSGPAAAWAYKEIAESELADLYIVVSPNHTGFGKSSICAEDYETPLGVVKTDKEMCKRIAEETQLVEDSVSHMNEHSVEVQIPFLQFACRDRIDLLRIVPIVLSGDIDCAKLGKDLKKAIEKSGKNVVIIVSSDMTHFGWNYGYMPFEEDIKKNLYKMDRETIKFIEKSDSQGFEKRLDEIKGTVCGRIPIVMLLNTVKADKIELLKYYTSADIIGDYTNAVGYAALVFK
ncbi:MAG: AmmeMemoRadiSam system protein B [Nanoarchaeota archaeon]|nr:AmmeMemoRadiSam system protein B [Nanoarchaeota archaeon]